MVVAKCIIVAEHTLNSGHKYTEIYEMVSADHAVSCV